MLKSKMVLLTAIFGLLSIFYCSSNDNGGQTLSLGDECSKQVKQAKYMEDILQIDSVNLRIPDSFSLSMVVDLDFMEDGKIIVLDNIARKVLLFDNRGNFLKQIGSEGSGPGEYMSPKYLAINQKNEIIVADASQFRLSIFNESGDFLRSFSVKHNIHGLIVSPNNEIIIYDPSLSRVASQNPIIYIYDEKGKLLKKFGEASAAFQKLKAIPFDGVGPYLVSGKNYLFEADYPDYHIRKYDIEGNFIKEFGSKSKLWRSLLKTNYQKLSPQKQMTMSSMRMIDDYFKNEFSKCTFLYCLKYFEPGIVCSMTMNGHHDFSRDFSFNFYDIEGNLLKNGLTFRNFPKLSSVPFKYFFTEAPSKLCLIEFLNSAKNSQQIKLTIMKLKCSNN